MHGAEWVDAVNIATGWGLTFALGFEREVRGAPAGDRTFSMIGLSAALIGTLAGHYPSILGGAVTGIGFIGGGLCFRQAIKQQDAEREILHGVTTAASIFGAAAIGAAAGCGNLLVAGMATMGLLLSLEIRHIPILRYLDARRWSYLFNDDNHRHFKLHEIERALIHAIPHQESGGLRTSGAGSIAAACAQPAEGVSGPADGSSAEAAPDTGVVVNKITASGLGAAAR